MIACCPKCNYKYIVDSNGKYECGICGQKFFLFTNGYIEPVPMPEDPLPPTDPAPVDQGQAAEEAVSAPPQTPPKKSNKIVLIIGGYILEAVLVAVIVFFVFKKLYGV